MKILLQLLCVSLIFSCTEYYNDDEAKEGSSGDDSGWTQSGKLWTVQQCQEGWGAYTQESKDYCECILSKCMEEWASFEEMNKYFEDGGSDSPYEKWVESCVEETN